MKKSLFSIVSILLSLLTVVSLVGCKRKMSEAKQAENISRVFNGIYNTLKPASHSLVAASFDTILSDAAKNSNSLDNEPSKDYLFEYFGDWLSLSVVASEKNTEALNYVYTGEAINASGNVYDFEADLKGYKDNRAIASLCIYVIANIPTYAILSAYYNDESNYGVDMVLYSVGRTLEYYFSFSFKDGVGKYTYINCNAGLYLVDNKTIDAANTNETVRQAAKDKFDSEKDKKNNLLSSFKTKPEASLTLDKRVNIALKRV